MDKPKLALEMMEKMILQKGKTPPSYQHTYNWHYQLQQKQVEA